MGTTRMFLGKGTHTIIEVCSSYQTTKFFCFVHSFLSFRNNFYEEITIMLWDQTVPWREKIKENWSYQSSTSTNYQTWVQLPDFEWSNGDLRHRWIKTIRPHYILSKFCPTQTECFGGISYAVVVTWTLPKAS